MQYQDPLSSDLEAPISERDSGRPPIRTWAARGRPRGRPWGVPNRRRPVRHVAAAEHVATRSQRCAGAAARGRPRLCRADRPWRVERLGGPRAASVLRRTARARFAHASQSSGARGMCAEGQAACAIGSVFRPLLLKRRGISCWKFCRRSIRVSPRSGPTRGRAHTGDGYLGSRVARSAAPQRRLRGLALVRRLWPSAVGGVALCVWAPCAPRVERQRPGRPFPRAASPIPCDVCGSNMPRRV